MCFDIKVRQPSCLNHPLLLLFPSCVHLSMPVEHTACWCLWAVCWGAESKLSRLSELSCTIINIVQEWQNSSGTYRGAWRAILRQISCSAPPYGSAEIILLPHGPPVLTVNGCSTTAPLVPALDPAGSISVLFWIDYLCYTTPISSGTWALLFKLRCILEALEVIENNNHWHSQRL